MKNVIICDLADVDTTAEVAVREQGIKQRNSQRLKIKFKGSIARRGQSALVE